MGKTISLKLTPEEEEMLDKMRELGISPSRLLRNALQHYVKFVEKDFEETGKEVNPVNQIQQDEVYLAEEKVYKELSSVDQEVNLLRREVNLAGEKVNLVRSEVNLPQKKVNLLSSEVNQPHEKVNLVRSEVNQPEDKFLSLYIDQLNSRINQQESDIKEWRTKHAAEVQYLKDSYNLLQTEYHNQVKDSIKRIDEKFDRIMFYLEESRKPILQAVDMKPESKAKSDSIVGDVLKVENKRDAEKPKKGWIFKMYRM